MEQEMKIDFKKLIIGVLAFSVLLVAFSLVYYYVYFLPQKEFMQLKYEEEKETKQLELEIKQIELEEQKQKQLQEQLEKEREEEKAIKERREYLLEECLQQAYDVYITGWNKDCEHLGKEKDCRLPSDLADHWNEIHREYRDDCFKKYPQD